MRNHKLREAADQTQGVQPGKFIRLVGVTLLATYILILIGSSVRASGAGMGCPDWPTCFGMLIPPTSVEQLPPDYQHIYADQGYAETKFNATKTWIEFGNRMASLVVGLLMLACLVCGLARHARNRPLMLTLIAMLALTAFQAWMGAVVVASHLHPLMVSSHMVLALAVIACLHAMMQLATPAPRLPNNRHLPWLFACGLVLLLQTGLGLQLRQEVDLLSRVLADQRNEWITALDSSFTIHMLFSLVALNLFAFTQFRLWQDQQLRSCLGNWVRIWCAALVGNLLVGLGLWLFNLPAFLQPLHLLCASVQFGVIWHLLLFMLRTRAPGAGAT